MALDRGTGQIPYPSLRDDRQGGFIIKSVADCQKSPKEQIRLDQKITRDPWVLRLC